MTMETIFAGDNTHRGAQCKTVVSSSERANATRTRYTCHLLAPRRACYDALRRVCVEHKTIFVSTDEARDKGGISTRILAARNGEGGGGSVVRGVW